jgi:hypothetical protein
VTIFASNDDTFEMETASSDALIQIQLLETSCALVLSLDDSQVTAAATPLCLRNRLNVQVSMSRAAAALHLVCSPR